MLLKNVELSFPEKKQGIYYRYSIFFLRTVNEMNVEMHNYLRVINSKHLKYICIYLYIYSFKEVKYLISLFSFFIFFCKSNHNIP